MKHTASTRHGSLILSGIDEIAHQYKVPHELASSVKSDFADHILLAESDSEAQYKTENGKIALLFLQWIQAIDDDDSAKADKLESEIDQSVSEHSFPYSETKNWYKRSTKHGYPRKASYTAARTNYRASNEAPWDNVDDFGIINETVPHDSEIGIIGDWGTGTEDAKFLLEEMLKRAPKMKAILHLGDIYQCGTPFECAQNFLDPINEVFKKLNVERIPIFTIPGNHEYFTGARGFFQLIDVLNNDIVGNWKQEASYFCLRSSDGKWQFLGVDTGLGCINHSREPGVEDSEVQWQKDRINELSKHGKTIFMTHHQFVSADEALNPTASGDLKYYNKRLLKQFGTYLEKIDLWIWGHDHWFIPYVKDLVIPPGQGQVLRRGQLLGGSARETGERGSGRISGYASAVQANAHGHPILPTASKIDPNNPNPLTNHTYGIIDLKHSAINYYEVGAWYDGSTPNKTAPSKPLLTVAL